MLIGCPPPATVVIPTYGRPLQVASAVESALAQTFDDIGVLVVDDASPEPADLPADPRLRVVRLDRNGGGAAARNVGLTEATGRWITYLDDDDLLLPRHLAVSLDAIDGSAMAGPVASLTGTEVVAASGEVLEHRMPPTLPRGSSFSLEALQPGCSYATKASLVVEVEVLRAVGGWDPAFARGSTPSSSSG